MQKTTIQRIAAHAPPTVYLQGAFVLRCKQRATHFPPRRRRLIARAPTVPLIGLSDPAVISTPSSLNCFRQPRPLSAPNVAVQARWANADDLCPLRPRPPTVACKRMLGRPASIKSS